MWVDAILLTEVRLWHVQLHASGPHHALQKVQILTRLLNPYRPILNAAGLVQEFNFSLQEGAGAVPKTHLQFQDHWRLRRLSGPKGMVDWSQRPSALMADQMALELKRITLMQPGQKHASPSHN